MRRSCRRSSGKNDAVSGGLFWALCLEDYQVKVGNRNACPHEKTEKPI
eukprot:SAG22_NODE_105_length_20045_cov_23.373308_10_plen_48_part_00